MGRVEIRAVTKLFGDVRAVDRVELSSNEGEFLVLLGPSGCGKTTLLRMLAGFVPPTAGRLRFGGILSEHRRHANAGGRTQGATDESSSTYLVVSVSHDFPPSLFPA